MGKLSMSSPFYNQVIIMGKNKNSRKRNTLRTARILARKEKRDLRHYWYINRKAGLEKGQCPI